MSEIQKIPHDNTKGRVETGPIQFGDDWAGYFIRGDNAFGLAMALQTLILNPYDALAMVQIREFGKDLMSCVQGVEVGLLAESADAADLKPADSGHEGSSPSVPTKFTPYQTYIAELPSSELPIQVGDKRLCAVDGFGPMEAEIVKVGDVEVTIKVIGEPYDGEEFELDWDLCGPNTYVGWKIGGEEHKKYLAQAELEAVNGGNSSGS